MKVKTKEDIRQRIQAGSARRSRGTPARPRLAVFRSQGHIYAQVIDDDEGTHALRGLLPRQGPEGEG